MSLAGGRPGVRVANPSQPSHGGVGTTIEMIKNVAIAAVNPTCDCGDDAMRAAWSRKHGSGRKRGL
jgi:hypothetical protein